MSKQGDDIWQHIGGSRFRKGLLGAVRGDRNDIRRNASVAPKQTASLDPTQRLTTSALVRQCGQTPVRPLVRMPGQGTITSMTHVTPNRSVSIP